MKAKESFFDRFEQSFNLFTGDFKNFINIFGLYLVYKIIFVLILGNILYFLFMNTFSFDGLSQGGEVNNFFASLFGSSGFLIWINIYLIYLFLNLILVIPFILATIKTIKDYFYGEKEINILENLKYGFKNLGNSFKTYWYMFAYVALIPLSILIIGGVLYLFGLFNNLDILIEIGLSISGLGLGLFIIFSIYRGLKSSFAIVSAVDKDEYTKENFDRSIEVTKNNWWRILGNFFLVSILLAVILGIINSLIGVFKISISDFNYMTLLNSLSGNGDITEEQIKSMVDGYTSEIGVFSIKDFLFEALDLILNTLRSVFLLIFTFIFFKRLEFERFGENYDFKKVETEKNVEL